MQSSTCACAQLLSFKSPPPPPTPSPPTSQPTLFLKSPLSRGLVMQYKFFSSLSFFFTHSLSQSFVQERLTQTCDVNPNLGRYIFLIQRFKFNQIQTHKRLKIKDMLINMTIQNMQIFIVSRHHLCSVLLWFVWLIQLRHF